MWWAHSCAAHCVWFDVEGKGLGGAEGLPYSSSVPFHGSCPAGRIHSEHALAAPACPTWDNKEVAAVG